MKSPWVKGEEADKKIIADKFEQAQKLHDYLNSLGMDPEEQLKIAGVLIAGILGHGMYSGAISQTAVMTYLVNIQRTALDLLRDAREKFGKIT